MPIYEYVCPKCELKFELLRSMSQPNGEAGCPNCNNQARRVLSVFAAFSKSSGGASASLGGASACGTCAASDCSTCS